MAAQLELHSHWTMSIFNSVKLLIQICQFSGLAPISKNQNTLKWEANPLLKAISIVFMVYSASVLVIVLTKTSTFVDYEANEIHIVLHILLFLFNHFHASSALLELFFKRKTQIELMNMFESIDALLKRYFNEHINYVDLRKKCYRIISIWMCEFSSIIICDLINSFFYSTGGYDFLYLCVFIVFYILNKLSYAYPIMLITIIHEELEVMNKYLKTMNQTNNHFICDRFSRQKDSMQMKWNYLIQNEIGLHIDKIHSMKSIYSQIWTAAEKVKHLNQWSLHIGLANEFFVLTFNLYHLAISIFFVTFPLTMYLLLSVLIAINLCNLLFIAQHCRQIVEDVRESVVYGLNSKCLSKVMMILFHSFRYIHFN